MSLALIGLGALLAASALTFTALKWLGAIYLIWLGINMLRTAVRLDFNAACSNTRFTPHSLFYKLFWVTVLNPKSIGFFVAFLPQFTDPARPVMAQSLIMMAAFVSFGALNALTYGYAANHLQARLTRPYIQRWVAGLACSVLIVMGALTAKLEQQTKPHMSGAIQLLNYKCHSPVALPSLPSYKRARENTAIKD